MNTLLGYDDVETKNCSSCGETFPKTKDYFPIASGGNYFGGKCRVCCRKQSRIARKLKEQHPTPNSDYQCAICGIDEEGLLARGYKIKWCLDHDHKTGKYRGYLCDNCNTGISKLQDSVEVLKGAIEYLEKHE